MNAPKTSKSNKIICTKCGATATKTKTKTGNRLRLPNKWKLRKHPNNEKLTRLLCGDCNEGWTTRTLRIPISRAVEAEHIVQVCTERKPQKNGKDEKVVTRIYHRHLSNSDKETHKLMQRCLWYDCRLSNRLCNNYANMVMQELAIRTTIPNEFETFEKADFIKHDKEIYAKCRKQFPSLPTDICVEVGNRAKALYSKDAFAVYVKHEKSLPTFRGGMHHCAARGLRVGWYDPRSISKKAANKDGHDQLPYVQVALLSNPESPRENAKYKLIPKLGRGHYYIRDTLRKVVNGEYTYGSARLVVTDSPKKGSRIDLLLSISKPPEEHEERNNVMYLETSAHTFLTHSIGGEGDRAMSYPGNEVKNWYKINAKAERRLEKSYKYIVRRRRSRRRTLSLERKVCSSRNPAPGVMALSEANTEKYRNRIDYFVHKRTRMIVAQCLRRRVHLVVYNDSNRSYFEGFDFPYHVFKERLRYKLAEQGIDMVEISELPKTSLKASGKLTDAVRKDQIQAVLNKQRALAPDRVEKGRATRARNKNKKVLDELSAMQFGKGELDKIAGV